VADDGWDWLLELPRDWERPEDLRGPTKSHELNLAILMLSSEKIGNDSIELVGAFVSEVARFNRWFDSKAKGEQSERDLAKLYLLHQACTRRVYEAWSAYREAMPSLGGARPGNESSALLAALRVSIAELSQASHD
jgi:hypothetical protein